MPVNSKLDGSNLTITVTGRFDFSVHQEFRMAYEGLSPSPSQYIVDLGETSYLDSSALGMLLALRDYAGGENANIKIISGSDNIKNIFLKSKLCEMFDIE